MRLVVRVPHHMDFTLVERFFIVHHHGANSEPQLNTVGINKIRAFQLEIKPQHCLILLHLVWLDTILTVCSIREYQSNVAENHHAGIEGYRKLRRLHWHSRLDSHV